MYYRDKEHKERFVKKMNMYSKFYPNYNEADGYYAAAYYIICSDSDLYSKALKPRYIGAGGDDGYFNGSIKFADILENERFSKTQAYLIKCAANLFNSYTYNDINIGDVIESLSSEQFKVYGTAMLLLRNDIPLFEILESLPLGKTSYH